MEKFITSIKKKYQERHLHRERQWPPCHSSKLITLLLVNRKVGEGYFGNEQRGKAALEQTRNSLHYSELFKIKSGKKPVRKVLVEGDAGIGKTTFIFAYRYLRIGQMEKSFSSLNYFCSYHYALE